MSLDVYLAPHLQRSGKDFWSHLASWWAQRDNPDVLLLSFELMQEDLRSHVAKVADFLGCGGDDGLVDLVTRQSTLEFMLEHEDRFNDKMHRERGAAVGSHPPGIRSTKVTSGVDPKRYLFSSDALARMDPTVGGGECRTVRVFGIRLHHCGPPHSRLSSPAPR